MSVLHVTLECSEGALRRLLGLIEARSFIVETLSLQTTGASREALLLVSPRDEARSIDVLTRQVNRLHGVEARLLTSHQAQLAFLASHGRGMHWA